MNDALSVTADKIYDVLQKQGSVSLSHLESTVNVSYNLLFLAIDRLSIEHKIRICRRESDYILSNPGREDAEKEEKTGPLHCPQALMTMSPSPLT